MADIRLLSTRDSAFQQQLERLLAWESVSDQGVNRTVDGIIADIRSRGDGALLDYTVSLDGWQADTAADLEIPLDRLKQAWETVGPEQQQALEHAAKRIRAYAERQMLASWSYTEEDETLLGQQVTPLDRVGLYVPGGKAAYPSSVLSNAMPAKVAGVETVVGCTPPVKGEGYFPATINAMKKAGADRIFSVGGVPAFALMAFGMSEVDPVDMLCGAGNKFVVEAKRQLFGQCGIDLLPGPTEIAIIADDSADPALVACDILGQAEHDPNSGQLLVCLSESFARDTLEELHKQLEVLPTKDVAEISWADNGKLYVADDRDEAIRLSDDYAPEHLEIHVEETDYEGIAVDTPADLSKIMNKA